MTKERIFIGTIDNKPYTRYVVKNSCLRTDFIVSVSNTSITGYKIKAYCLKSISKWAEVRLNKNMRIEIQGVFYSKDTIDEIYIKRIKLLN